MPTVRRGRRGVKASIPANEACWGCLDRECGLEIREQELLLVRIISSGLHGCYEYGNNTMTEDEDEYNVSPDAYRTFGP